MKLKDIVLAGLMIASSSVYAGSDWTSYQGNSAHTGYIAIKTNPEKFHKIWERKLGAPDLFVRDLRNAIIVGGTAYYIVTEVKYEHTTDYEVSNSLVAVNTNTGDTMWTTDLVNETPSASLHYTNDMLLVHENKEIGTLHQTRIIMFDPKTGRVLYSMYRPERAAYTESDNENLYEAQHYMFWRHIISFNPKQASINWDSTVNKGYLDGFAVSANYTLSQFYYNTMNPSEPDTIYVHDRKTGAESVVITIDKETTQLAGWHHRPVIDDVNNAAYLTCYDKLSKQNFLFAFDLQQGGKIKWKLPMQSQSISTPAIADNEVYVLNKNQSKLNAVDVQTGSVLWSWNLDGDKFDRYASPLVTADVIFVSGEKNTYAVSRKSHQAIWKINKTGSLSIGDNKLFIRSSVCKINGWENCTTDYITAIALN